MIKKIKENNKLTYITNAIITIIITITTCILPLIPLINKNPITYYVIGICLFFLLIIKRKEIKFDKKDKVIFVFLIFAILSTIFALNKKIALLGSEGRYEGLLMIILYVLLYYSSKNFFIFYKHYLKIVFLVVTLIAIYSVCQYYNFMPIHDLFNIDYTKNFSSGTLGNPNFLGSFITMLLPITMASYLFTDKRIFMIITLILFTSLLCTLTRSAWVAFAIYSFIGLVFVIKTKKRGYFIKTGILLCCFIIIFALINILDTNKKLISRSSNSMNEMSEMITEGVKDNMGSGRIFIWRLCYENIFKYPLFGCGLDNIKHVLILEQTNEMLYYARNFNKYIDKAHNEYLQIAVTMGIPALVCYLTFIALILENKIKKIFKSKLCFIFCISIIGYLIQAFFNISVIQVAPLFWILLGLSDNIDFVKKLKENYSFLTK